MAASLPASRQASPCLAPTTNFPDWKKSSVCGVVDNRGCTQFPGQKSRTDGQEACFVPSPG